VGSIQDVISAIGKTFELAGLPNPLYQTGSTVCHIRVKQQLEAFRREDPPTQPQLAVPVAVPNWIYLSLRNSTRQHIRTIGELCLITIYFLLCVGEYIQTHATHWVCTQQFQLRDICFFFQQKLVPLKNLLQHLEQVDLVRLQINNQKMGEEDKSLPTIQLITNVAQ